MDEPRKSGSASENSDRDDKLATVSVLELAEKPVLVTNKGLVGIATAPIEPGHFLSWIHGSFVYIILREVKCQYTDSDVTQQHRIVARAAVMEELVHSVEDMKALINSTPSRQFRVV